MPDIEPRVLEALKQAVGPSGWLQAPADIAPYLDDERQLFHGRTALLLRPATTAQCAEVVSICAAAGTGIVPQGGNTGYVGGAVPDPTGTQILVSLSRMDRIRAVDPINYTMTVEAGCILSRVQQAAAEVDRLFPLSLAAEGSCQIGGNLSSNAGGTAVLRYGNARDLVLGIEVVLPDGRIWDGLRSLRKNNTGYDLKQLFVGAEGTLGIITAAVLKLYPQARESCTCLAAVRDIDAALDLLTRLRSASGDRVASFEYLHRSCIELVLEHVPGIIDPMGGPYEHYVLLETDAGSADGSAQQAAETALEAALEQASVLDAVVAGSSAQAEALWQLRESIPEAQKRAGACIKHDVSVPVSRLPEFLQRATELCQTRVEGIRVAPFGHLGDGNIHFNLSPPPGYEPAALLDRAPELTRQVHDLAVALSGSFSAEHGIGLLKKGELTRYCGALELELMRRVKAALDPQGIMNPGKLL